MSGRPLSATRCRRLGHAIECYVEKVLEAKAKIETKTTDSCRRLTINHHLTRRRESQRCLEGSGDAYSSLQRNSKRSASGYILPDQFAPLPVGVNSHCLLRHTSKGRLVPKRQASREQHRRVYTPASRSAMGQFETMWGVPPEQVFIVMV